MNSNEFKRWLEKKGCLFTAGKGSHLKVYYKGRQTVFPMHAKKEMGKGLVKAIIKQLEIEE